jgi:WD40 repeat protein
MIQRCGDGDSGGRRAAERPLASTHCLPSAAAAPRATHRGWAAPRAAPQSRRAARRAGADSAAPRSCQADELIATLPGHAGRVNCVKWIPAAGAPRPPLPPRGPRRLRQQATVLAPLHPPRPPRPPRPPPAARRAPAYAPRARSPPLPRRPAACGAWHGCQLLASGGADGAIRVWAWRGAGEAPAWVHIHTLEVGGQGAVLLGRMVGRAKGAQERCSRRRARGPQRRRKRRPPPPAARRRQGHEQPVTSVAVQPLDDGSFLLASTSGGPDLILWRCAPAAGAPAAPPGPAPAAALAAAFGPPAWALAQRLHVGTQTQLCAALAPLPGAPGWLLLATGGADNAVRLHVAPPGGDFHLQCKLSGHENWVRSVALAAAREEGEGGEEVLLLASGSQDRCAGVWGRVPWG